MHRLHRQGWPPGSGASGANLPALGWDGLGLETVLGINICLQRARTDSSRKTASDGLDSSLEEQFFSGPGCDSDHFYADVIGTVIA